MADNGLKSVYVSKAKHFQHIILLLNSDKFNRGNIHAYVFTAHSPYIRALTSLGQAPLSIFVSPYPKQKSLSQAMRILNSTSKALGGCGSRGRVLISSPLLASLIDTSLS